MNTPEDPTDLYIEQNFPWATWTGVDNLVHARRTCPGAALTADAPDWPALLAEVIAAEDMLASRMRGLAH